MQKISLKKWIGYGWILKNLVFFLFLAFLAVLYIANGHVADNTLRDINKTAKEVKDLQYEYKALKSDAISKSRETHIAEAAAALDLKVSETKPIRLVADQSSDK